MDEIDISLAFGCLPPSNNNEWMNLKHFVDIYNTTYDTNYILEAFPERENRSSPQPEVLLRDGEMKMVIERKVFVWPPNFIKHHQLWHEFNHRFFEKRWDDFTDGVYAFEISNSNIPGSKREIIELVIDVTKNILENKDLIHRSGCIVCIDEPIEWKFYRLPELEREDYPGESGIVVRLMNPFQYYDERQLVKSKPEITSAISKLIEESVPKFDNFIDCLRILIVEPYTNILNLTPEILGQIMKSIEVPLNIDQIWLASQIELDDLRLLPDYRQVMSKR
jgi:hypothetical protein